MDLEGLKAFDNLILRKGDRYLRKLPQSTYQDRVSEIVWGVKSEFPQPRNLYSFAIANIKNSRSLLVWNSLKRSNWQEYFTGLLKNPGLMCEYFIVDYLGRNSHDFEIYKNKRFRFNHKKGPPEQDEELKIDFMTTMTTKNNAGKFVSINFGVQLTTSKSKAYYRKIGPNGLDWIGRKKGDICRSNEKIEKGVIDNYPPSYIPDTMCLFVINSSINELINVSNVNIFKNAFNTWIDEGFLPGGPSQYLSNIVKKDLEKINDGYHLGMEILYKLVSKLLLNNRDFKSLKKYDHFDIIFEYEAHSKELKMDYFLKDGVFLMSLFFIVNDKLVKLINPR